MKTLLLSLQSNTDTIGLKYLHSYLIAHQVDSHFLFVPAYRESAFSAIKDFLRELAPRIIGISLMSHEFRLCRDLGRRIKDEFPDIILVTGGIHPSIRPGDCLDFSDYVFIGESEESFLEFVKAVEGGSSPAEVPNLVYRSSGELIRNRLRPLNENLDDLSFPEHFPRKSFVFHQGRVVRLNKSLFKRHSRYSGKFYSLTTTRGCPFSCSYCCNSFFVKLYGKGIIRKRSVDNVIEELKEAIKTFPDIVYVNIQDDCFFAYDPQWMKQFSHRYRREIGKHFTIRTTPHHITEEKVRLMKEAGLSWLFMGLQTGSERVNREIFKRFIPNEKFLKATRIAHKYNIAGFYDVILDNPYETEEDVTRTLRVILQIPKPFQLQIFSLCFYPGTELADRAEREGLKIEDALTKNYFKYQPDYLNKLIRLSPIFPRKFIFFLLNHNKSLFFKLLIKLIYLPAILLLEPLVWLRLFLLSFDYNPIRTCNMIYSFFSTGVRRTMLRK